MLFNFQKDTALAIINKLEKYNGSILADSVGLGKTFTALAVIKYYENRNKSVLVLCPKKLTNNWNTYKAQLKCLQEGVVDIEEMSNGINIMDLGLNEFRLDLLEYEKTHPNIDKTPFGLHCVVPATDDDPAGVIYVLKKPFEQRKC